VLNGEYSTNAEENKKFMSLVMVGALNVGRIIVKENKMFERGT
jgi:phosphatidylserine decarboxylase